jgi:ATP synthase protein I
MSYAVRMLRTALRKLLIVQLLLVLPVVLVYAGIKGGNSALAAGYGGGIALINAVIMAWRVGRTSGKPVLADLYRGASVSFGMTLLLMGVGMGILKLDPPALLFGFAAAYLGYPYLGYQFNRTPINMPD